jgi:3-oxoacyl-[acyl-carrier-protein] synthase I
MTDSPKLYIAGMGMITPVGADAAMTAAAVKAGISAYTQSDYAGLYGIPITMTSVPLLVFDEIEMDLIEGDRYNERHDRILKLGVIAIREACAQVTTEQPIPCLLAMAEEHPDDDNLSPFIPNLEQNCKPWINIKKCRSMLGGRSIGIEAIDYIFRHLESLQNDYVLVGSSDSYHDYERLSPLIEEDRLLKRDSKNGFAPGEGSCFLLLTTKPELAMNRGGFVIALHPPGIAEEPGHLGSKEVYRGEGLDAAFKKTLKEYTGKSIQTIYSSMNGESHWAKEYGVAYIRNKDAFDEKVKVEHPVDCYGDLGAASGTALIALAAEGLFKKPSDTTYLVYSSSDSSKRGAIIVEKIQVSANSKLNSHNQQQATR